MQKNNGADQLSSGFLTKSHAKGAELPQTIANNEAKTKGNDQLICIFIFAYMQKSRFSHDTTHLIFLSLAPLKDDKAQYESNRSAGCSLFYN